MNSEGLKPLLEAAWKILQEVSDISFEPDEKTIVYEAPKNEFIVEKIDDIYYVKGKRVEKLVSMTDFSNTVSLRRFEKAWRFMGIDRLLKKQGIQEGDVVDLYGVEFSFTDEKTHTTNESEDF